MMETEANIVAWHFMSPAVEKVAIVELLALASVAVAVWTIRRRGRGPQYT